MNAPPIFFKESIDSPSGPIDLKLFFDRNFSTLHIYAAQNGSFNNYSSSLLSSARAIFSYRKIQIICYLSSQEEVHLVKEALLKYVSFSSN